MRLEKLKGWNVSVLRIRVTEQAEGNGEPHEVDGWALVFTEVLPPTGDQVIFEFGQGVRDFVVRELTGGIVLAGGDLPSV